MKSYGELRLAGTAFGVIAILYFSMWPLRDPANSDFVSFYSGARLVSSRGNLYSMEKARRIQEHLTTVFRPITRPPFYFVLLQPLTRLPYSSALWIWQILNVAALLVAAVLFARQPSSELVLLGCFVPLWYNMAQAQDIGLLLLAASLSLRAAFAGHSFLGGVLLSLCMSKPHIFVASVIFAFWKSRQFLLGLTTGVLLEYLCSCYVMGWDWLWPLTYADYIASIFGIDNSTLGLQALILPLLLVWLIRCRPRDYEGLAVTLGVGLVTAQRPLFYDASVLFPGAVVGLQRQKAAATVGGLLAVFVTWHVFGWWVSRPLVAILVVSLALLLFRATGRNKKGGPVSGEDQ